MPVPSAVAHVRAKLAVTIREDPNADVSELRAELKVARAEDYIQKLVAEAPPLNEAQRARLAALLMPTRVGGES